MARRLPAGMLRHTVIVQSRTTDADTYGQQGSSTGWVSDREIRAHIENLSGREAEVARQLYASATHRITIEYTSSMASTGATRKRLTLGDRTLHIGHVLNPELENWHLEMLCGEER